MIKNGYKMETLKYSCTYMYYEIFSIYADCCLLIESYLNVC